MVGSQVWLARMVLVVSLLGLVIPTLSARADAPPGAVSYDDSTGHNVREPFLSFWYAHGDADVLGAPLTEALPENGRTVQYFANARLEQQPNGTIVPAALGIEARAGQPDGASLHAAANGFRRYWDAHDGQVLLGAAISDELPQAGDTVQFFERGALRWRPDRADKADDVQMLPLGRGAFDAHGYPTDWLGRAPSQATSPVSLRVPVLMYHHIGPASRYFTSAEQFTSEMGWLQQNGYHTVTISQMYQAMFGGRTLPDKPIALTFDDGNADQVNAFPILRAHGFIATYFIVANIRALSDAQLVDLIRSGNEIESHTSSHPYLTRIADGTLAAELQQSKASLETRLGIPMRYIAYPYGDSNGRVWAAAQAAGYRGGINATGGINWEPGKQFWEPRIEIGGTIGLSGFAAYAAQ